MAGAGDWQLTCKEMTQRGANLLASGQWSDCTFLVGAEPNQLLVRGHKLLLAMASPVFEAMFYGNMAERNDPISILDVQPDAFKALLEYIYTDNIDITSFDKACELCYGAKKYMLPHLVKECTKYLWSDLHPKNACRAYEFARLFEEPVLMDKCIQIICANTKEVLADSSFEEVELNTIMTVFSLDYLTIDSELDLFEAAVRYANAQGKGKADSPSPACDKQTMDASTSKVVNVDSCESPAETQEADAESPACKLTQSETACSSLECSNNADKAKEVKEKPSIRSAVEQIRFLTLTPQQFAQGPALSSLLTESESFAVLMNILSSSSDIAMPSGFTTCRVPRKPLIGINNTSNIATFTVDTPSPIMVDHVFTKSSNTVRPVATSLLQPAFNQTLQSVANTSTAPPVLHPLMSVHMLPEHVERHASEFAKIYCQRPILQHTDCLNTSVLDCSVTFMVDKNICLLGVQVPTQVLSEESTVAGMVGGCGSSSGNNAYSELLYAHLLDADGARLTYTHYTSRVPYRCLLDIMFNRPVYIQRNKVYKVGIVFNKVGWYPMGTCAQQVPAENVYFNFGIGQTSDSVRDGLIRSIIFTY